MARLARADIFDPAEVSVVHCINRCVRRCFLCGDDPYTGRNYNHRKAWLEQRLAFLAGQFGIDVLGFAILSNHFHLVLRNRPDVVATWSDTEVASRWLLLCPLRKQPDGQPAEPTAAELDTIRRMPNRLAEVRRRLSDVSWLMRMIAEPIARRANREDQVTGRFWQGRFKAVKLCDEAAILACSVYVDLNPIRAGLATTLESSDFTSIQRRIESLRYVAKQDDAAKQDGTAKQPGVPRPDAWLAPIPLREAPCRPVRCRVPQVAGRATKVACPSRSPTICSWWTGPAGKLSAVGADASRPTCRLSYRVGIAQEDWLPLVTRFGRLFQRVAGASHARASDSPRCAAPAPSIPTGPRGTARPTLSQPAGSRRKAQNLRHARNSTTAPEQKAPDKTASHSPATRRNHRPPIPLHPSSHPATIDAEVGCHRSWVSPGSRGPPVPARKLGVPRFPPPVPPFPSPIAISLIRQTCRLRMKGT